MEVSRNLRIFSSAVSWPIPSTHLLLRDALCAALAIAYALVTAVAGVGGLWGCYPFPYSHALFGLLTPSVSRFSHPRVYQQYPTLLFGLC